MGQAQELAAARATSERPADDAATYGRQHYASFTMELLLDEANSVRRTRVVHVQGGESGTWSGWDPAYLMDFVVQHAELHIEASEPATSPGSEPASETTGPNRLPLQSRWPSCPGTCTCAKFTVWPSGGDCPCNLMPHDQPFCARVALDLADVLAPSGMTLDYAAMIYARSLSGRGRHLVGEARGSVTMPAQEIVLHVDGVGLAEDVYRLQAEATVDLAAPDALALLARHAPTMALCLPFIEACLQTDIPHLLSPALFGVGCKSRGY